MEPEDSLSHLHARATGLYLELAESSPKSDTHIFSRSVVIIFWRSRVLRKGAGRRK
jgi:hypothetical protein